MPDRWWFRFAPRSCSSIVTLALLGIAGAAGAAPPDCRILGSALSCGPAHLCASMVSDELEYQWTGPESFTSTASCIDAPLDGRYVLRVTNRKSREFGECEISIKVLTPPPCAIGGKTFLCRGGSTTLCAPAGEIFTYAWSGPDGKVISTERCLIVTEPGAYELDLFDTQCHRVCATQVDLRSGPECGEDEKVGQRCRLTGKGWQSLETKKSKKKKEFEWSGQVKSGCDSKDGDAGDWKHVDHLLGWRFEAREIHVVRCGDFGDKSKTPGGYIEFEGAGRLRGNDGKKNTDESVHFRARVEVGVEGDGKDPESGDRYFLHVFGDPANPIGTTRLLVDDDDDPATIDPITVDHGKMKLAVEDCGKGGKTESFAAPPAAEAAGAWLAAPRPNPASKSTLLRFSLPRVATVSLTVHDVTGRLVRELASGVHPAGEHQATWDFADRNGARVRGGVFFVRLVSGGRTHQQAITVIP